MIEPIIIESSRMPSAEEAMEIAARLCADFGLNPLGAISSGALLICIDPAFERRTVARSRRVRIPVTRIGTVVPRRNGVTLTEKGCARPFPRFVVDEVARFF
jgi:hydrogenase maturation factor